MTVHRFERFITAALKRDVKLRAEFRDFCKLRYYIIGQVIGLKRAEPDSFYSVKGSRRPHRVNDCHSAVRAVGGKIDAYKHYFAETVSFKNGNLRFQFVKRL